MFKLASAAAILGLAAADKTVTFPIKKTTSTRMDMLRTGRPITEPELKVIPGDGDTPAIIVHSYQSSQFYAEMDLGTPGQTLSYIFDTGSSNLWTPGQKFTGHKNYYNHDDSSTYVANGTVFDIEYGSGPVSGFLSEDVASIGGVSFTTTFAEITDVSGLGTAYTLGKFDGICGMAWPSIAVDSINPPFFDMIDSLPAGQFSFYLPPSDDVDGELMFGGSNPDHYTGDLQWVPLSSEDYWSVAMDSWTTADGDSVTDTKAAIVDSGTSLLTLPVDDAKAFAKKIGATMVPIVHEMMIDCDAIADLPDITITLNGNDFTFSGEEYTINQEGSCLVAILGMDIPEPMGPLVILGDPFMSKYYSVFDVDNSQVGFALAQ